MFYCKFFKVFDKSCFKFLIFTHSKLVIFGCYNPTKYPTVGHQVAGDGVSYMHIYYPPTDRQETVTPEEEAARISIRRLEDMITANASSTSCMQINTELY